MGLPCVTTCHQPTRYTDTAAMGWCATPCCRSDPTRKAGYPPVRLGRIPICNACYNCVNIRDGNGQDEEGPAHSHTPAKAASETMAGDNRSRSAGRVSLHASLVFSRGGGWVAGDHKIVLCRLASNHNETKCMGLPHPPPGESSTTLSEGAQRSTTCLMSCRRSNMSRKQ
jgi:hypothetical protein